MGSAKFELGLTSSAAVDAPAAFLQRPSLCMFFRALQLRFTAPFKTIALRSFRPPGIFDRFPNKAPPPRCVALGVLYKSL